jgi:hypothetical protein
MRLYFEIYDKESTNFAGRGEFFYHITNSFVPDNLWITVRDDVSNDSTSDETQEKDKTKIQQVLFGYIEFKKVRIEINGFLYLERYLGDPGFIMNGYQCYKDEEKCEQYHVEPYPNVYNTQGWETVDNE